MISILIASYIDLQIESDAAKALIQGRVKAIRQKALHSKEEFIAEKKFMSMLKNKQENTRCFERLPRYW